MLVRRFLAVAVGWLGWGWWVVPLVVAGLAVGVYAEWRAERRRSSLPDDQRA